MPTQQDIYSILEKEIVNLVHKPGDLLSENSLCQRFAVSRTPIRSVLQRLAQGQFVEIISHKGTLVTAIDLGVVSQLIYQRVAVEATVLRDFVRVCLPTDVARVRFAMEQMQQLAQSAPVQDFPTTRFLSLDMQMHEIWFAATGKQYLWQELTKPHPDYSRFIRFDMQGANNVADVLAEHTRMLACIETKDTSGIEQLMTLHLYGGVRRLGSRLFSPQWQRYFKQSEAH